MKKLKMLGLAGAMAFSLVGVSSFVSTSPASADSRCSMADHTHPHYNIGNWHTDIDWYMQQWTNNGGYVTYQHYRPNHTSWQTPVSCQ